LFPNVGTPTDVVVTPAGSPSGSFDAFIINFVAIASGNANITIIDGCDTNTDPANNDADCAAATQAWFDDVNFLGIPAAYTQANVVVNAAAGPDITVTDSVPTPDDLAVGFGSVVISATPTQTVSGHLAVQHHR
jgi:hypothetical protein